MRKLLFLLLWPALLQAQNFGAVEYTCGAASGKTILCYRLPDSTTVFRTAVANSKGFFNFNLPQAGLYLIKYVASARDTAVVARFSHIPIVAIGGDSTSNAGRIIQNALDSLPSTGGVINLPPGTHLIDSTTITVNKSNVTIRGTGDNCILRVANSLNAYAFTVADNTKTVNFEAFAINGNKANQTAGGGFNVNGSGIKNINWDKVHIRHTYDHGIVLANGVTKFSITNSTIDSTGTAGQTSATTAFPIYLVTTISDGRIEDNNFNWWSGIAAVRINNNCRNIRMSDNEYRSNDRTGSADRRAVFAGAATNDSCRDIHLLRERAVDIDENAFFFNFVDSSSFKDCIADSAGNHGFELNGNSLGVIGCQSRRSGSSGLIVNNAKGGVIADGIYEFNGARGIHVFAATGDSCTDIALMGNVCRANSQSADTTYAGLEIGSTGTGICRRITIMGNPCGDAVAAPRQRFGIVIQSGVDWYTVVGNIVTPKGSGAASGLSDGGGSNKYVPAGGNP